MASTESPIELSINTTSVFDYLNKSALNNTKLYHSLLSIELSQDKESYKLIKKYIKLFLDEQKYFEKIKTYNETFKSYKLTDYVYLLNYLSLIISCLNELVDEDKVFDWSQIDIIINLIVLL